MKINLVLPHQLPFPPTRGGGVESLVWMMAQEFARQGQEVVAYSRKAADVPEREVDRAGIRHVRVEGYDRHPNRWIDHLNGWRYARTLSPLLETADVTSFHTPFSFWMRRKPGLGICAHTIHRTPKWPVPLYRKLDRVYCGSDAVVEQARAVDPKMRNLKRIHNGISLPDEPPARPLRSRPGLLFLYVGRFVADKGLASLVHGFEESLEAFPENLLKTVGPQRSEDGADARFFERLSQEVQSRNLGASVEFLPPIFKKERLNELMAEADVICVPSLSGETFSMAVLEAMAGGKPVLVSDFKPMPEAVDHAVTGYVARAGDPASVAEGIRYFSENADRLAEMGRAGFAKAKEHFSVERIAAEYLADFQELIAGKGASHGANDRVAGTFKASAD